MWVFLANGGIFVMDARLMIDARVMYWQRLLIVDLGVIIDDSSNDSSHLDSRLVHSARLRLSDNDLIIIADD